MIAEAVEAVHVLMWALAGWIVVFAAAATLLLLAGCAAVAWAWRVVRAFRAAHRPPSENLPFPALTAARRRPQPSWVLPGDLDAENVSPSPESEKEHIS